MVIWDLLVPGRLGEPLIGHGLAETPALADCLAGSPSAAQCFSVDVDSLRYRPSCSMAMTLANEWSVLCLCVAPPPLTYAISPLLAVAVKCVHGTAQDPDSIQNQFMNMLVEPDRRGVARTSAP